MINNAGFLFATGIIKGGCSSYNGEDNRGQPGKIDYIIWTISTLIFIFFLLYGIRHLKYISQEKTYHGVIISKRIHPCYDDNRFKYNLFFLEVKFDSIPVNAHIIVDENTYKKPKNSRIAFTLSNQDLLRYCYREKFTNQIWKILLIIIPILVYVVFFFVFGIPLILYFIGFNSWLYKQKTDSM